MNKQKHANEYSHVNENIKPIRFDDFINKSTNPIEIQNKWWTLITNNKEQDKHFIVKIQFNTHHGSGYNYYQNCQLVTDLFDIVILQNSRLRSKEIDKTINYMLRTKEYQIDLSTYNIYAAKFSTFNPQNNEIIFLANPSSDLCRELINKRIRLNKYL